MARSKQSLVLSLGTTAFAWGFASAVSLPQGAFLEVWLHPRKKINSAFMAFGAGALPFALTIELFGQVPHHVHEHGMGTLIATLVVAMAGGLLFDLLNSSLDDRGAFLRKLSSTRRCVARHRRRDRERLIEAVSRVPILTGLRPEQMAEPVRHIRKKTFAPGQVIFRQ